MENNEIIGYATTTPNNTNPNVLRDMLRSGGGSGASLPAAEADGNVLYANNNEWAQIQLFNTNDEDIKLTKDMVGYNVTTTPQQTQTIWEDTVTPTEITAAGLFAGLFLHELSEMKINDDQIVVVFNGTSYTVPVTSVAGTPGMHYGEWTSNSPDFTNYPFYIQSYIPSYPGGTSIYTQSGDTYSMLIKTVVPESTSIEITNDFKKAVEEVTGYSVITTPSNARTLDWNGNESLTGNITLGKGTADEVTLTAAQLKSLLALLTQ